MDFKLLFKKPLDEIKKELEKDLTSSVDSKNGDFLYYLIEVEDPEKVKFCLEKVNKTIIKCSIKKNIYIRIKKESGEINTYENSILHRLCYYNNNFEVFKIFFEYVKENFPQILLKVNDQKSTIVHFVMTKPPEFIKYVLEFFEKFYPEFISREDINKYTILNHVMYNSDENAVKYVLDFVEKQNSDLLSKNWIEHLSSIKDFVTFKDIFEFKKKNNTNLVKEKNTDGYDLIKLLLRNRNDNIEIYKYVIEEIKKIDPSLFLQKSPYGNNVISFLSYTKNTDIIKYILGEFKDPKYFFEQNNITKDYLNECLEDSTKIETIKNVFEKIKESRQKFFLNKSNAGDTILHFTCKFSSCLETVKCIFDFVKEYKLDIMNEKNNMGENILDIVSKNSNQEIINYVFNEFQKSK